jgi:hypothetical protein
MTDIPLHHIVYGHCTDYLTGTQIVDTDDERYRQTLARFMVEKKGFKKTDLESRLKIETLFSGQFVTSNIDMTVAISGKRLLLIRYGPGSLVTRERPAVAAARVLEPEYQIPLTVVTNGKDAEILDTYTGKILNSGLQQIPSREQALKMEKELQFLPIQNDKKRERELRILNAFDVQVCCVGSPCTLPDSSEG